MRKTQQEMLDTVLDTLRSRDGITETSPGSVARTFAEVIIEEFHPFYEELDLMVSMSFVSSATGSYLDLIGELLNCKRLEEEEDEEYRARIINQVSVLQTANLTALRIKALQVQGVADVQFRRFTSGTGSFTCYVTPQEFPIDKFVLHEVETVLSDTAGYGIDVTVKVIEETPIDLYINVIFHSKTTPIEKTHIQNQISDKISAYMNSLAKGAPIVINEISRLVMETNSLILDMEIREIYIKDKSYFIKNIEASINEKYYLRKLSVA